MTREPATPEEPGTAPDPPDEGAAAGADGLPLASPDDWEKRRANDSGQPEHAGDELESEEKSLAEEISAERGAD